MAEKKGRLTKKKFGYSMPVDAPLYGKPPIYYKNTEAIIVPYETDADAALDMLPEGLEIPTPATASVLFIRYNFSTLGLYNEVILGIDCLWQGAPKVYVAHIVVDNDVPLAGGREVWGYPKKLAHIEITREADLLMGTMERPKGNRIVTAILKPQVRVKDAQIPLEALSLRVIPASTKEAEPPVMELVEAECKVLNPDLWTGIGSVQYHSTSVFDPWHKLEVKKVLEAQYVNYDYELGLLKVLKRY